MNLLGLRFSLPLSYFHRHVSVSCKCSGILDNVKSHFNKQNEERQKEFQSWAEFENRGFRKPEYMNAWIIEKYGRPKDVLKKDTVNVQYEKFKSYDAEHTRMRQAVKNPSDILVKVHAASINPIDVLMCQGYMRNLMNIRRSALLDSLNKVFSVQDHTEFPLVFGRDFSGTVVDVGSAVYDVVPGDEVYGTQELHRLGTLADYVCIHLKGVCQKPGTLSHVEAAALPYVASTVLSALKGLTSKEGAKRALVLGGAGGIGTFAIQYLKAEGFYVAVTCSVNSAKLCTGLGADTFYDYTSKDFHEEVKQDARFDLVFDTVGTASPEWAVDVLNTKGTYVTLKTPLANFTDDLGLFWGLSATANKYLTTTMKSKINVKWGYFSPDRNGLLHVGKLVDSGSVRPAIQDFLDFENVPLGFDKVESGRTKGKIVINVSGLQEATDKPDVEKIIHL